MKRKIIYVAIALVAAGFLVQPAASQEKAEKEKKEQEQKLKEEKLKQAIELQKKAMEDQHKKQAEIENALKEAELDVQKSTEAVNEFYRRVRPGTGIGRDFPDVGSFYVSPGVEFSAGNWYGRRGGDSERTTWDFSKYVKESTFSKKYSFDVEKSVATVVMTVMGDCKSGEIRVKILMPGGKTYSDILIDEFGNLNWRKSFNISEEENLDKAGEWIFAIDAVKATGSFKISLQTY